MPRVTQKGQVTIPRQIRSLLTIKAGDEVVFDIKDGKIIIRKKVGSIKNLKNYIGFLSHLDGEKPDDIIEKLRGKSDDICS